MRLNIVQPGAVGWVWDSLGNELAKHLDAEAIITPLAMHGADAYAVLCSSVAPTMTPGVLARAVVCVNHFERDKADRTMGAQVPALKQAAHVVCLNEPTRKRLADAGVTAHKIPHGVDCDRFAPMLVPAKQTQTHLTIGVGGRRYPNGRKGEIMLPVIAAKIARRGETARFVFIGPADTWRVVADDLARIPGIEVSMPVDASDYGQHPRLYNECDALIVTSFLEGGPVPPLEALACGVPVVSTPCGWMPELVVPGTRNVSIYENPDTAVDHLLGLVRQRVDRAMVRATVVQTHAWPKIIRQWADLLCIPYVEATNA